MVVLEDWVRLGFYFLPMKTLERKFLNNEGKTKQPVWLYSCKFKCQQTLDINQVFKEKNATWINSFLMFLDAVYQHVPGKRCHHKLLHLSSHTERNVTQTKDCLQFLNLQPVTSAGKRSPWLSMFSESGWQCVNLRFCTSLCKSSDQIVVS